MDEFEDRQPRLGAPAVAALLATVLLAAAISYNALWRQGLQDKSSLIPGLASTEPAAQGSTRMVVNLDQPHPTTVTLRYDSVVESVQRELAASGLYDGPVDGVSGRRTELAILAYQRQSGLGETGTASQELVDHIQLARQFAAAADTTASLPPTPPANRIRSVQLRLAELGYDPGSADGELGGRTQIAIRRFEEDRGLPVTGGLSDDLIAELNKTNPRVSRAAR